MMNTQNRELAFRVVVDRPRAAADIRKVLTRTRGDLRAAAGVFGVSRSTLRRYVDRLGLGAFLDAQRAMVRHGIR